MFQATIEKTLSAALGKEVTIGKFALSPFAGTLQVDDLRVGGDLLCIRKAAGKISMAKALAKTIAIKTLTVEGVSLRIDKDFPPKPSNKSGKNAVSGWKLEAGEISLSDLSVEIPAKNILVSKISGELKHEDDVLSYDVVVSEVKIAGQVVNPRPLHARGKMTDVENLLALDTARLKLGIELELDLGKLLSAIE